MDKLKILVVDDESRMRKLVRDFLEREGYAVLEAGDGMEAMDIFYEEKDIAIEKIKGSFEVLNISREYKGRGNSQYSNVYIDANIIEKISNK